jgi:hypothetical protein
MIRHGLSVALVLLAALFAPSALAAPSARTDSSPSTLVLPLHSVGVSDTTILVSRDLLLGSLQDLGVNVAPADPTQAPLPRGSEACDDPACAAAFARQYGAARVVYGSISKLGVKIIARLSVLRVGESAPYYRDQLTATSEEDLDRVMRRFAEGIAAGRPNSDRASVESVTQAETLTPARRATRSGLGIRAGFLFPSGNSFAGADRLTNLRAVYVYEMRDFLIESSTLLGLTWGKGNLDWTILDLSASRIFGSKDFSTYLGAAIGVHTVTVEQRRTVDVTSPYFYETGMQQTETAPTVDLVAGIMALRTYDFEIVLDLRYHYVFEKFDKVGGGGAQGVMVTFGTSR